MKYLLLNRNTYIELREHDEERVENLFKLSPRPKTFILQGTTYKTDDVIGFTDDKPTEKLGIRSMDDLRAWVKQQPWYQKPSDA